MKFDFAPMEGITGYTYRNAHKSHFIGIDRYYTPFLVANQNLKLKNKERNDIAPMHNQDIHIIPQILSNKAGECLWAIKECHQLGYDEVNINLGCPSPTVVTKGKGAGMLKDLDQLDMFLDELFTLLHLDIKVSIKTRIGVEDDSQAERLISIFNKYPISELIIHPRVPKDFYKKPVHLDTFEKMLKKSKHPVTYNGNILDEEDYHQFIERFPEVERIMLGRGMIANPAFARELLTHESLTKEEFLSFHHDLLSGYQERIGGDKNVLFKMKELWYYFETLFYVDKKSLKAVRKAKTCKDYKEAVEQLVSSCAINNELHKDMHFR